MHQLQDGRVDGSTSAAISNAVVQLLRDFTGRGPTRAKTAMGRDVITVVLEDTMTKAEKSLAGDGQPDFVLNLRHRFQMAMRDDLIDAVENLADRKVIAFMSDNHIDPDIAAEIFVLEPQGDSEAVTG